MTWKFAPETAKALSTTGWKVSAAHAWRRFEGPTASDVLAEVKGDSTWRVFSASRSELFRGTDNSPCGAAMDANEVGWHLSRGQPLPDRLHQFRIAPAA